MNTLRQAEIFIFMAIIFLLFLAQSHGGEEAHSSNLLAESEPTPISNAPEVQPTLSPTPTPAPTPTPTPAPQEPTIVILSEQNPHYRFQLGRADVPEAFRKALDDEIIPLLDERSRQTGCDAIEVVGHTDGSHVKAKASNLDLALTPEVQSGEKSLQAASNVELGMLRALEIMKILQQSQAAGKLQHIKYFFVYSSGQMILPDGTLAADDSEPDARRRRVEIRLLKYHPEKIARI